MTCDDIGQASVGNALAQFVGRNLLRKTAIDTSSGFRFDNVPHLVLTHLSVYRFGHFVIGMHLYAQVLLSVNKLDEQWHLPIVVFVNGLSEYLPFVGRDDLIERFAGQRSVSNDAGAVGNAADLPGFTNRSLGMWKLLPVGKIMSAPNSLV